MCKLHVYVENSSSELICTIRANACLHLETCAGHFWHCMKDMRCFFFFFKGCYFNAVLGQNFCLQLNKITCRQWHILCSLLGVSNSWITS